MYNAETKTMLKNKLSEEKRENPVGKPPLKMNTESSGITLTKSPPTVNGGK